MSLIFYLVLFNFLKAKQNDPYDTLVPYVFSADYGKYYRLLESVISIHFPKELANVKYIKKPAEYLSKTKLSYEELINKIDSKEFTDIFWIQMDNMKIDSSLIMEIQSLLKQEIHKYVASYFYVSSFSKRYDNPIIWSHYADQHKGFCMIFKPYNNSLYIDPLKNIDINGHPNSEMKKYEFRDVKYKRKIKGIDGFLNFSGYVNGKKELSQKDKDRFWEEYGESARAKYIDWKYEEEVRLIDFHRSPEVPDENGAKKRSQAERIFYYDKTQFCGIIFGTKMNDNEKNEVISTIREMRALLLKELEKFMLPPFVFYDAVQNPNEFKINKKFHLGLGVINEEFCHYHLEETNNYFEKNLKLYKKREQLSDSQNAELIDDFIKSTENAIKSFKDNKQSFADQNKLGIDKLVNSFENTLKSYKDQKQPFPDNIIFK